MGRALAKAREKGVKIRILTNNSQAAQKISKDLKNIAEIKQANIKGRFMVIDNKSVVLLVTDDTNVHPTYDSAIWSNSEYLATAIETLFDNYWKTAN